MHLTQPLLPSQVWRRTLGQGIHDVVHDMLGWIYVAAYNACPVLGKPDPFVIPPTGLYTDYLESTCAYINAWIDKHPKTSKVRIDLDNLCGGNRHAILSGPHVPFSIIVGFNACEEHVPIEVCTAILNCSLVPLLPVEEPRRSDGGSTRRGLSKKTHEETLLKVPVGISSR